MLVVWWQKGHPAVTKLMQVLQTWPNLDRQVGHISRPVKQKTKTVVVELSCNTHIIKRPHRINLWFDFALLVKIQDSPKSRADQLWMVSKVTKMISTNCTIRAEYIQRIKTFNSKICLHQIPVAFVFTWYKVSCTYRYIHTNINSRSVLCSNEFTRMQLHTKCTSAYNLQYSTGFKHEKHNITN